jgi:hypothetical protein
MKVKFNRQLARAADQLSLSLSLSLFLSDSNSPRNLPTLVSFDLFAFSPARFRPPGGGDKVGNSGRIKARLPAY